MSTQDCAPRYLVLVMGYSFTKVLIHSPSTQSSSAPLYQVHMDQVYLYHLHLYQVHLYMVYLYQVYLYQVHLYQVHLYQVSSIKKKSTS